MSEEKLFTVVGTAINTQGELKMRWANDLTQRISILIRLKCDDINLHETPQPMTKLDAAQWLYDNTELTPAQEEVVAIKIEEKAKVLKRKNAKSVMTENIKKHVKENKKADSRVSSFIEKTLQEAKVPNVDSNNDSRESEDAVSDGKSEASA